MITKGDMDLLAKELLQRFGKGVASTRELYSMQLGGAGRVIEVQYDPYNRRLKLFDATPADVAASTVMASAIRDGTPELYSKIIVYSRPGQEWQKLGLRREVLIRGFFGDSDAELWAVYPDPRRASDPAGDSIEDALAIARAKQPVQPSLPPGYSCAPATRDEAGTIAELMAGIFPDYPTPISPQGVADAMEQRTSHFRVVHDPDGRIAACASAEMHHSRKSAELTDCATRPEARGRGLMSAILRGLEHDLLEQYRITDVYTIARAGEVGMNCSFAKLGYEYTGCLVNNCRMPQGWESMNVWCRNTAEVA